LDLLDSQPFLFLEQNGSIQSVLAVPIDPPRISWIHTFACKNPFDLDESWKFLFHKVQETITPKVNGIFAVGLENWFTELLLRNHFQIKQDIVVLFWNHHMPEVIRPSGDVLLRPMLESDLDEVAAVDATSFEAQWINSKESLHSAYFQSERTTVAEVAGKIVAYEMTTANQFTAHLARLAVLPEFRRSKIAKTLVTEMLRHFSRQGVMQLSVNTQSDNATSLHLYQSMGFEKTGETFPVLQS
jgi:ribosomal-protein-alanine N-acetyltransferase